MIIADASVIVPLLVRQNSTSELSHLLRERVQVWIAPLLWKSEVLNVLASYVRFRGMPVDNAEQAFKLACRLVRTAPFTPGAWMIQVVAEVGCSGYDAQYVTLALQTGATLVTNDRRLVKAAGRLARTPEEYLTGQ